VKFESVSAPVVADVDAAVIRYRSADEGRLSKPAKAIPSAVLFDVMPWRTFGWYQGQRHYSGTYWCATELDHVIYESRLELAVLILADFEPAYQRIIAQPFQLTAPVGGQGRRHTPDFLVATDDGPLVIDVVRAERLEFPEVQAVCSWTQQVIESVGWRYGVHVEPPPTMMANVRFLAGYRRDWLIDTQALSEIRCRTAALAGVPLRDAERAITGVAPPLVRAALMHLLWQNEFTTDLSQPLQGSAILEVPT
jgi:hypothetical protein